MANELIGKRIAIVATDGVEQSELVVPWDAARRAGAIVQLVSQADGEIQGMEHADRSQMFPVDMSFASARANDFDALILPGGVANPDRLRMDEAAVRFVRHFFDARKPVAAICHAPWVLVEAGVLRGRTLTSWPSLRTDIRNAGGAWVDEEVHVDDELITSRKPGDLPAFCREMIKVFAGEERARRAS